MLPEVNVWVWAPRNRTVLFERIGAHGENCAQEYRFTSKHGLEAFRDHWALVDKTGKDLDVEGDRDQDREPR